MKISGNAIRPGYVIHHQNRLWVAVKIQHTQPGKGGAYLQVELKDIREGTKLNERFRSSESVERVRLDEQEHQFLFQEGTLYTFMDTETYDQISLPLEAVGEEVARYLKEGTIVKIQSHEGSVIGVSPPDTVILTVEEADPVVKGQTASASYKPALLENGMRIMVPPHVEAGMRIVVNTDDGTYVERAKE